MEARKSDGEEILPDRRFLEAEVKKEVNPPPIAVPICFKKVKPDPDADEDSCQVQSSVKDNAVIGDGKITSASITKESQKLPENDVSSSAGDKTQQEAPNPATKKKKYTVVSSDDDDDDTGSDRDTGELTSDTSESSSKRPKLSKSSKEAATQDTQEMKFKCDVCFEKFSVKTHYTTHTKIHINARPYSCDACGVVLMSAKSLKIHLSRHTGQTDFKCTECDKGFAKLPALKRHMLIHTGDFQFECNVCGKRCAQKSTLEYHMVSHKPLDERPRYNCHLCPYSETYKSAVQRHLAAVHVPFVGRLGYCP